MQVRTLIETTLVTVTDNRCEAGPGARPFAEQHCGLSLAYVRRGSFGYRYRGRTHELVAGAVLAGHPGDEYVCTHDHHACGDECLSFRLSREALAGLGDRAELWRSGALPPLPGMMVLGELRARRRRRQQRHRPRRDRPCVRRKVRRTRRRPQGASTRRHAARPAPGRGNGLVDRCPCRPGDRSCGRRGRSRG